MDSPAFTVPEFSLLFFGLLSLVALYNVLSFAGFGAFGFALMSEVAYGLRKKIFYDKFARQLCAMGTWLLAFFILAEAGIITFLFLQMPELFTKMTADPIPAAIYGGSILLSFALCLVYRLTWKSMKKKKPLHKSIGFFAVLSALGTVFTLAYFYRHMMRLPVEEIQTAAKFLEHISLPGLWTTFALFIAAAFLWCAVLSMLYLILRRTKDDFGRDYYNFIMRYASGSAVTGTVLFLVAAGVLGFFVIDAAKASAFRNEIIFFTAFFGACTMPQIIFLTAISKSLSPMRLKPVVVLVLIMTLFSTMGLSGAYMHLYVKSHAIQKGSAEALPSVHDMILKP
jgi:hypothetical protein